MLPERYFRFLANRAASGLGDRPGPLDQIRLQHFALCSAEQWAQAADVINPGFQESGGRPMAQPLFEQAEADLVFKKSIALDRKSVV